MSNRYHTSTLTRPKGSSAPDSRGTQVKPRAKKPNRPAAKNRQNPATPQRSKGPRYALARAAAYELESLLLDEDGLADETLLYEAYDSLHFPVQQDRDFAHIDDPVFINLDALERLELRNAISVHGHACDRRVLPVLLRKLKDLHRSDNP